MGAKVQFMGDQIIEVIEGQSDGSANKPSGRVPFDRGMYEERKSGSASSEEQLS